MMSRPRFQWDRDDSIQLSLTPGIGYDFNSPEALLQHPVWTPEPGEPQASNKWKRPTVAEILSVLNPWWNMLLVTSYVIAVLCDPLFFYIPYIKEEEKCVGIDKQVRTAALVSRTVTDVTFLVHIIYQLREAIKFAASRIPRDTNYDWEWESVSRVQMIQFAKEFSRKLSWRSFLIEVFAIFPMPQVLIVIVFFGKRDFGYLDEKKVLNVFLLIQYWPRIYLLRRSFKHSAMWIKVAFNFFLYLFAAYVLGALWYFISIQREISCWYLTCIKYSNTCSTFHCDDDSSKNITLIDESCPMNTPNATVFDFGIFTNSLQSSSTGSVNFSIKMFYTFWWGLRNLSNFATNLETSNYLWENCFAILVSITGLILFIYLIGNNVQRYMDKYKEVKDARAEEVREKILIKKNDIEKWMGKNGLQEDMKEEIMKNIKQKLEEDINADLEDPFSILPWYTKKALKRVLCMSALRKVPMLSQMDEKVLKMMCDYLKPVNYPENTLVFQMGGPLDQMVFITEGFMWTYTTPTESSHFGKAAGLATSPSMDTNILKKGDSYGHALLQFASPSLAALPTLEANVRCHTKVEAFVLMAEDLRSIVTKCEEYWPFDYNASQDDAAEQGVPLPQPFAEVGISRCGSI